ncbi:MAG: hypothetical protein HQM06_17925 [Magnetococcales bacterium]|nr:hypothetical protein [Magnetococcales bacterium]
MPTAHPLWSVLEISPGQGNILPEWRRLLGTGFDTIQFLLRPTDFRVSNFPYPGPGGYRCVHRVVDCGNGKIVAVCNDEEQGCDNIMLSPADIIVYELNRGKLAELLAHSLHLQPAFSAVEGLHQTFLVGDLLYKGSRYFPVFLTLNVSLDRNVLCEVAAHLLAKIGTPLILLGPTRNMVTPALTDLMTRNKSCFLPLSDLLVRDDSNGTLTKNQAVDGLVANFIKLAAPDLALADPMQHFPTPPDASWEQFTFEFLADELLIVRCKGVPNQRQVEPEHLNMKRRDNGKPTLQWVLLMGLARNAGRLSWSNQNDNSKLKAQKQALSRKLKHYFLLNEEPIPWQKQSHEFESRFILRQYKPKNREWFQNEMRCLV